MKAWKDSAVSQEENKPPHVNLFLHIFHKTVTVTDSTSATLSENKTIIIHVHVSDYPYASESKSDRVKKSKTVVRQNDMSRSGTTPARSLTASRSLPDKLHHFKPFKQ
jgi:hypothetical protein